MPFGELSAGRWCLSETFRAIAPAALTVLVKGDGFAGDAVQLTGMLASFITLPQTTMSFLIWL